jgi:hypothetical protein
LSGRNNDDAGHDADQHISSVHESFSPLLLCGDSTVMRNRGQHSVENFISNSPFETFFTTPPESHA